MLAKQLTRMAVASLALVGAAHAAVITLDFEGLQNGEAINGFYNGGTGSLGSSGTNYGIAFGSNTLALIDGDAPGGTGNFANEPSPDTIMFFLSGGSVVLNYAAGFTSGFSFYYVSNAAAQVNVYDGLNATGNLLGSINLSADGLANCSGDPSGQFCNWHIGSVGFAGTAMSIDFGGVADQVGFDNITFGSTRPGGGDPGTVPEPGTLALVGAALAGLGWARRRRG